MKFFLLAAGLMTAILPASGQETQTQYNKTVFRDVASSRTDASAVSRTQQKVQTVFPQWGGSMDKLNATFKDIYGPAISIPGGSINEKVQYCFNQKLNSLGVVASEWKQTGNTTTTDAAYVNFDQKFDGHKVVFSRLSLKFTAGGELVRVQMRNYGQSENGLQPSLTINDAKAAATKDLTDAVIASNQISTEWEWFPIPSSAKGYELHPAWHYEIAGTTKDGKPLQLSGYVDALTGEILYRTNEIKDNLDITVKGIVYKDGTTNPATLEPLANLKLTIGGINYYTDTAGLYSSATLNMPAATTVALEGRWSKVIAVASGNVVPSVVDNVSVLGTTFTYPPTTPASSRHINAFYHVNRVHDFMKGFYSTFTGMDIVLPTNVDVTGGSCNAFYNGTSINFYAAGGGCNSFAEIGDIIYHEYGHGISDKFYNAQGAGTINNGALNEGSSDVWAMCITHNPILGQNAFTGGGNIRRYDQAPKVYPQDITGEVHADGEIIAGAWWDVAVNLGSADSMAKLFTGTYYDTPDGPDGTEGDVYHSVLISALQHDDIDNNLNNGTPHFLQIVTAFAKHGIYLLNDAVLTHTELAHQPANTLIPVTATLSVTYQAFLRDLKLYYKKRGSAWDSVSLTNNGSLTFTGAIPAQDAGSVIDYYFVVHDTAGYSDAYFPDAYSPLLASTLSSLPYQFAVGVAARDSNTFEGATTGWHIGNNTGDDATAGIWIQGVPIGSFVNGGTTSLPCQPGFDHTTGTGKCLVTGNAGSSSSPAGTADVDNGTTTVLSPVFDLSNFTKPVIEYYRWYSDDRSSNAGSDEWMVQVRDSNSSFWHTVDGTYKSDYNWRRKIFALSEYLPATTHFIQMKFIASDKVNSSLPNNGQGIVEAAMDDFFIYDLATTGVGNSPVASKAKIFPNPADEQIAISLPTVTGAGSIKLYDVLGRCISALSLENGVTSYSINTGNITAGQYIVIIQTAGAVQSQKVIIRH